MSGIVKGVEPCVGHHHSAGQHHYIEDIEVERIDGAWWMATQNSDSMGKLKLSCSKEKNLKRITKRKDMAHKWGNNTSEQVPAFGESVEWVRWEDGKL